MAKIYVYILTLIFISCSGQLVKDTVYYNKEFNWTIKLPKEYTKMNNSEWNSKVEDGGNEMEKHNDIIFENQSKPIFIFKANDQNCFESTEMPYDIVINGNLKDYLNEYNNILINTYKSAKPDLIIDTVCTTLKINELDFDKCEMTIRLDENSTKFLIKVMSYNRIFSGKLFSVNIIFNDEKIGYKMIQEMEKSKFK